MDSLKAFVDRHGPAQPFEPTPGVLVLGAGKGGVGTSTVTGLLGLAAADAGMNTLLVDADESTGALSLLLGMADPGPGLWALRDPRVLPRDLLVELRPGLTLLPGGGGGADATYAAAVGERRALLRRISDLYPAFDLVLVDGGSRLESVMAACGAGAERLLAVTLPDRIAMAAVHALYKVARSRFPGLPIEVVINGRSTEQARATFQLLRTAAEKFLNAESRLAGGVPEDPGLRMEVSAGMSLPDAAQGSLALEAAALLLRGLRADRERNSSGASAPVIPLRRAT